MWWENRLLALEGRIGFSLGWAFIFLFHEQIIESQLKLPLIAIAITAKRLFFWLVSVESFTAF